MIPENPKQPSRNIPTSNCRTTDDSEIATMLAPLIFWLFMARHRKPTKFQPVYHKI